MTESTLEKNTEGPMLPAEIERLEELENIVENGKQAFLETGNALLEIRDSRLYRRDYDSWEAYLGGRHGFGRTKARQLMNVAEFSNKLPPEIAAQIPDAKTAESLSKLEPAKVEKILKDAAENGPVARRAIFKHIPAPEKPNQEKRKRPNDEEGYPIPDECLELWDRRDEIGEAVKMFRGLKSVMKRAEESGEKAYREVNFSVVLTSLDQAIAEFRRAVPYAVCSCGGMEAKNCRMCGGKGMISQFAWETLVSREFKEIRAKVNKKNGI